MKFQTAFVFACFALSIPALAQEQADFAESFSRLNGASIYDLKSGIDGSAISEEYVLDHATCTDGSRKLRILLPLGPDDDGNIYDTGGPPSTLKKKGTGYTVDFKVYGKSLQKSVQLKPVKDPKSHYHQQFEVILEVGDPLWKAMRDKSRGKAIMMIGQGGTPVELPNTSKFNEFLKSCGISAY